MIICYCFTSIITFVADFCSFYFHFQIPLVYSGYFNCSTRVSFLTLNDEITCCCYPSPTMPQPLAISIPTKSSPSCPFCHDLNLSLVYYSILLCFRGHVYIMHDHESKVSLTDNLLLVNLWKFQIFPRLVHKTFKGFSAPPRLITTYLSLQ